MALGDASIAPSLMHGGQIFIGVCESFAQVVGGRMSCFRRARIRLVSSRLGAVARRSRDHVESIIEIDSKARAMANSAKLIRFCPFAARRDLVRDRRFDGERRARGGWR
jgi:hypothetical protein